MSKPGPERRRVRIADIQADPGYRQEAPRTFLDQLTRAMEPDVLRATLARLHAVASEVHPEGTFEQEDEFHAAVAEAGVILQAPAPAPTPVTSPVQVNEREGGLFIIDGWTRLKALERVGVEYVDAEVWHLTREDEVRAFLGRNEQVRRV